MMMLRKNTLCLTVVLSAGFVRAGKWTHQIRDCDNGKGPSDKGFSDHYRLNLTAPGHDFHTGRENALTLELVTLPGAGAGAKEIVNPAFNVSGFEGDIQNKEFCSLDPAHDHTLLRYTVPVIQETVTIKHHHGTNDFYHSCNSAGVLQPNPGARQGRSWKIDATINPPSVPLFSYSDTVYIRIYSNGGTVAVCKKLTMNWSLWGAKRPLLSPTTLKKPSTQQKAFLQRRASRSVDAAELVAEGVD